MASFNQITLLGRVGSVDIKTFSNGGKNITISLATSKKFVDRNNYQQEETQWHRLVVSFDRLVEIVEQYVRKGDLLFVTGEMTYRKYTDNNNVERSMPEVRVTSVQLMPKTQEASTQVSTAPVRPLASRPAATAPQQSDIPGVEEDMPDFMKF